MLRPLLFLFAICFAGSLSAQVRDTLIPFQQDTLWGYKNGKGEVVIAPQFTGAGRFEENFAVVSTRKERFWSTVSIIDRSGKMIVPATQGSYTILKGTPPAFLARDVNHAETLYDTTGRVLYSCSGCSIARLRSDFMAVPGHYPKKDSTVTIFNSSGKVLFTRTASRVSFIEDLPCNAKSGGERYKTTKLFVTLTPQSEIEKKGNNGLLLDYNYNVIEDSIYSSGPFYCGKGVISYRKGQPMFVDTSFKPLLPPMGYIGMFYWSTSQCLAVKNKDSLNGIIDTAGNVIIPCMYRGQVTPLDSGFAFRVYCDKCLPGHKIQDMYILRNGDTLLNNDYRLEVHMSVGKVDFQAPLTISHKKTGKFGVITYDRSIMIPCRYDALGEFHNGLIPFFRGDTAGYLDSTGKEVIELWFPCYGISNFENGRALCSVLLPGGRDQYPTAQIISDGQKTMARRMVWIDDTGQIINRQSFDWVKPFRGGVSMVVNFGQQYLVDTNLVRKKAGEYDYCSYFFMGYAVITDGKKFGLADFDGKIVVPVIYDEIAVREDGFESVKMIDQRGKPDGFVYHFLVPDIKEGKIKVKKEEEEQFIPLPMK